KERSSVADRRDKEREREDDKRRREDIERERRAGELREAWRRRHPTEEGRDKDSWPTGGDRDLERPATTKVTPAEVSG
ncbi:MAG: hypothetical protein M3324_03360, partial [Actinomycetota bacterium]|nr:hypothetical protein [Actinomycetota bacterium]